MSRDAFLTTREVAELSRRHEETVLVAARRGLLVSHQSGPRGTRRYPRSAVEAWIARGAPYLRTAALRATG